MQPIALMNATNGQSARVDEHDHENRRRDCDEHP